MRARGEMVAGLVGRVGRGAITESAVPGPPTGSAVTGPRRGRDDGIAPPAGTGRSGRCRPRMHPWCFKHRCA